MRRWSFTSDPISLNDHRQWFAKKLMDPNAHMYMAELDGQCVGQIRFDVAEKVAEVSVSVDSASRGKGYGTRIIMLGLDRLCSDADVSEIHAQIKSDNKASLAAFHKAGFLK